MDDAYTKYIVEIERGPGPWFICPKCKNPDVTATVYRCFECGALIRWVIPTTTKEQSNAIM